MTCNLIEALPFPLLIISGSCAWKNYLKTLSPQVRHIKVHTRPGVYCLFVLDFGPNRLRRILSLVTGSHFLNIIPQNPKYRPKYLTTTSSPIIRPASCNSIIPPSSSACNKARQPSLVSNGLTKCHAYVQQEKKLRKHLTLDQYDQTFINWALQIYGVKEDDILLALSNHN
jgi:hypothetical protein